MENFIYASLDKDGYCNGVSQLSGEIDAPNMIRITENEQEKIGYKYDIKNKKWTDEKLPPSLYIDLEKEKQKADMEYIKCLLEIQGGIM